MKPVTALTITALACLAAVACSDRPEQVVQTAQAEADPRCVVGVMAIEGVALPPGAATIVHDIRSGARRTLGNAPYNTTIPPIGDDWEGDAPGEAVWRTYFQTRGRSLVSLCPEVQAFIRQTGSTHASDLPDPERSGPRLEIGAPVVLGDAALVDVGDFVAGDDGVSRLEYYRRSGDAWSRAGVLVLPVSPDPAAD